MRFYSRYLRYRLTGTLPGEEATPIRIDFSGGEVYPDEGIGIYDTDDADIISWLEGHPLFGIDFAKDPFADVDTPPPRIYTREELLNMLIDAVVIF